MAPLTRRQTKLSNNGFGDRRRGVSNRLARSASLKIGPIALEILLRHYFGRRTPGRVKKEDGTTHSEIPFTQLRQDELFYDEAFNIVKRLLDAATHHSIEELQAFSATRILSPPWVHIVRATVPMSCCDQAAAVLIQALGGEEHASLLVGGTKWWQVRGVTGITGEWVTAKKDWEEVKKRRKASQKMKASNRDFLPEAVENLASSVSEPSNMDMDDLRCILFAHGGGYYFGSVDHERYCIQRLARKIKGRVFAINYRLAPQYPFPCALQDLIAAYLYLIKPPSGAPHRPVNPAHIVVAGDSAGGGLALALLQVLRDTGQPLPAGGILISPWCDLTHSFPSIHTNSATDVLPQYGLSLHKPSTLWPPPSEEMTHKIHSGIRRNIRQIIRVTIDGNQACETTAAVLTQNLGVDAEEEKATSGNTPVDSRAATSQPSIHVSRKQAIALETEAGEQLKINSQVQLYTQNSLLVHPLVSPAVSYLGGLPPLFIIAGDKEVLRDEIVYSAHKAADPSKFPLRDEHRALYPPLVGIEKRYGPTQVHLQVYDDVAHVLPVIFPFTTPAKYCYRAMATFTKHVTSMLREPSPIQFSLGEIASPSSLLTSSPPSEDLSFCGSIPRVSSPVPLDLTNESPSDQDLPGSSGGPIHTADSSNIRSSSTRPAFFSFRTKSERPPMPRSTSDWTLRRGERSMLRSLVRSPNNFRRSVTIDDMADVRYAGETRIYYDEEGLPSWKKSMIRERVSTQGSIRPLESANKLDALLVPPANIGILSERTIRCYLEGSALFDQKYTKEFSTIEKKRNQNINLAERNIASYITHLQELQNTQVHGKQKETSRIFRDGLESSTGAWGWACADERPPPSSIVSRRDTDESREFAHFANQATLQDEVQMKNNNLWTMISDFLVASPEKERPASGSEVVEVEQVVTKKSKSIFASFRIREKSTKFC